MNNPNRLSQLLVSLEMEISGARAGSEQGQFPILDLIGNVRDEAATAPECAELRRFAAQAWEKLVCIVESGQPFTQDHIAWLNEFRVGVERLTGTTGTIPVLAPATPAPAVPPPAPAPVVTPARAAQPALVEEMALTLNLPDDADLLREFINESREHLDNIEQGVLVLEEHPDDAETLNTIFRAFHTFKGGAGFLNLVPMNRLAHALESLLDLARQEKIAIDRTVIDLILRGRDVLKQFLHEIEGQINGKTPAAAILIPTEALKAEVRTLTEAAPAQSTAPTAPASPPASHAPGAHAVAAAPVASAPSPAPAAVAARPVAETQPAALAAPPTSSAPIPAGETAAARQQAAASAMVKVDTGKLEGLLDLVGELVIAQSLVAQNLQEFAAVSPQFARNMAQMGRITRELQRVGMSLRMVPIRGVFQKMARVARDLSVKQHKKVQFLTTGDDTELDRGVVEELNDPLLHMIRNSMDHGIEPPNVRTANGKLPVGTLQLRAYHQGGNIVVEIEDDGAGLNRERILKKALERGLASPNATLTDAEVYSFVFAAGFSTAEKVTDLSGRGVGLDWCAETSSTCVGAWTFPRRRAAARNLSSPCRSRWRSLTA